MDWQWQLWHRKGLFYRSPGYTFRSRHVNHSVGCLLARQLVKAFRAVDSSLQFGDVSEIVQREWVIGIQEVSFIEKRFGFLIIAFAERFDSLTVQLLNRSQVTALGKRELKTRSCPAGERNCKNGCQYSNGRPRFPGHYQASQPA